MNTKKKSIVLYLMSEKGLAVLKTVIQQDFTSLIASVVIGRDKNVVNDFSSEIHQLCEDHRIQWCYKEHEVQINCEYSIAVSWRWLLPTKNKLIIFHDSPLPRYRGFAPLVNQLINGEQEIAVTALFGSEEYDRGEIIATAKISINYPITIYNAIQKSLSLYSDLTISLLDKIHKKESIRGIPQDESKATYSLWRDERDYYIDWSKSSDWIERFVNATGFPYLMARSNLNKKRVVVKKVEAQQDVEIHNRDIGKVIFVKQGIPFVVCGRGLLSIQEAFYEDNRQSIIPIAKFRSRFE